LEKWYSGFAAEVNWDAEEPEATSDLTRKLTAYYGKEVQTGATLSVARPRWREGIDAAADAIRAAYSKLPPAEALNTITTIWEHLERVSDLAAARSRILMAKLPKPLLAATPSWFADQVPALAQVTEGELPVNPLAIETAELLVQAVIAKVPEPSRWKAKVTTGPMGRVIVDWLIADRRLQWMVEAVDMPWPSVKIYQLARIANQPSSPPETNVLHTAFEAIDFFTRFTHSD
jgi:hypothetical protein